MFPRSPFRPVGYRMALQLQSCPAEALPPQAGDVAPHPEAPTSAAPGSAGKLAVLASRAQAGLPLFHPADNLSRLDHAPHRNTKGASGALPAGVTLRGNDPGGRGRRRAGQSNPRKRYRARVWDAARKKKVSLGLFETVEEAAEAVRAWRKAHEGGW